MVKPATVLQIVPQPTTNLNDLLMGPLRWINFSSDNHIWGLSHRCHGKNNDGLATDNQSTSSIKMNVPDSNFGRALCFIFEFWAQLETFFRKRVWAEKNLHCIFLYKQQNGRVVAELSVLIHPF